MSQNICRLHEYEKDGRDAMNEKLQKKADEIVLTAQTLAKSYGSIEYALSTIIDLLQEYIGLYESMIMEELL